MAPDVVLFIHSKFYCFYQGGIMLGDFTFHNPTKLHFGKDALTSLTDELKKYGQVVQLVYGGGSIKKNGIYDAVVKACEDAGKIIVEDAGVMPNPTADKLREGVKIGKENNVDFILSVGGGSCADYAKAVSISIHTDEDPWEKYFLNFEEPTCEIVPVGVVLTMAGTGSEMNGGSVISDHEADKKIGHVFGPEVFPKFAILNPEFTYSLPKYQLVAGIYDTFNHICEQYFSDSDDNTTDYIAEGLMRSVIRASYDAVENPENYEARSNIMWSATWALNRLLACGKTTDWEVHMLGHAVGALSDATHGMTLSAVSLPYYRYIMKWGLPKFVSFAKNVFDVKADGKTDEQIANEGLDKMEAWMREIGCVMNISDLGCDESMLERLADATVVMQGGYHVLSREEIIHIFKESL